MIAWSCGSFLGERCLANKIASGPQPRFIDCSSRRCLPVTFRPFSLPTHAGNLDGDGSASGRSGSGAPVGESALYAGFPRRFRTDATVLPASYTFPLLALPVSRGWQLGRPERVRHISRCRDGDRVNPIRGGFFSPRGHSRSRATLGGHSRRLLLL